MSLTVKACDVRVGDEVRIKGRTRKIAYVNRWKTKSGLITIVLSWDKGGSPSSCDYFKPKDELFRTRF